MAIIPNHDDFEVHESEVKVFTQSYYLVSEDGEQSELRKSRVEVLVDNNGVFIECKETHATETLSIPTPTLAIKVAEYVLEMYYNGKEEEEELPQAQEIKFLTESLQNLISHELWRLSNHITSPHGPVDPQGAKELHRHVDNIANLLDIRPKPLS